MIDKSKFLVYYSLIKTLSCLYNILHTYKSIFLIYHYHSPFLSFFLFLSDLDMATMATALLILLMAAPTVLGTNYKVGDAAGWDSSVDYTTWASDKTFTVGDTLGMVQYIYDHKFIIGSVR